MIFSILVISLIAYMLTHSIQLWYQSKIEKDTDIKKTMMAKAVFLTIASVILAWYYYIGYRGFLIIKDVSKELYSKQIRSMK